MNEITEYVLARQVLLDALEGLGSQRDALVLVGAQAIYAQVGAADLAVPPMTTDGDLALDPRLLSDLPLLGEAMQQAGFVPAGQPGSWRGRGNVCVDLMVPAALAADHGRRGVDLGVHGRLVARYTAGLEAAMVDHTVHQLSSLTEEDTRSFSLRVAGPAALWVAKQHKLGERAGTRRMGDKDALDVLRLLRGAETHILAQHLRVLAADPIARAATQSAFQYFEHVFVRHGAPGPEMAARAAAHVELPTVIRASTTLLSQQLWEALRDGL